ncbi:two-component system response regulator [Bermanella sp. R86510]|uniref:response regulator n=1 Tax=unclassified Bermanella TaxID=2627862 RepID=UPI0037CA6997
MDNQHKILTLSHQPHFLSETLGTRYPVVQCSDADCLIDKAHGGCTLVVMDFREIGYERLDLIDRIRNLPSSENVQIIVLFGDGMEQSRVKAFEMGCDDYIHSSVSDDEIALRCEKLIFNYVANEQLQAQVKQANELAFIAMSDTSDLGINIQFLLDVHTCTNLDELGMRLLRAIGGYGLKASLQLRSELGTKNMDLSGMAKDLEANLLWELKDGGRYVDFGKRSVMNYEQVSLLVKNMPVDDEKKYGALKDNIFSLLQGADARLKALENVAQVQDQQEMMRALSLKMQSMMENIDEGYQGVMKDIADVVENMSDQISGVITNLGLHEDQERALENIMAYGIENTNTIFNSGLKLDERFQSVVKELGGFLSNENVKLSREQRLKLLNIVNEL